MDINAGRMGTGQARLLREMRAGFRLHGRTIFALLLREARIRHGRSRLGYAWAVIEPFAIVAMITLFFSGLAGSRSIDMALPVFVAIGVVSFQYFRHTSAFIGLSFEANRPLFNYPNVHELDAALARLLLDSITSIVIAALVMVFLILAFDAALPAHPQVILLSYAGLGLLAFGVGLNVAALQRVFMTAHHVYGMVMAPSFFLSAVLYSLEGVPPGFRDLLVWNPIAHGIEGMRLGYYPAYHARHVDLAYLYLCAGVFVFSGLFQLLLKRRGYL